MRFTGKHSVTVGDNSFGNSDVGTISVMAVDCAGSVGIFVDSVFYPHPEGALAAGEMLTFECGSAREVGFNATTAGQLTISRV